MSLCASISVPIGAALSGILFRDYGFYVVYIVSTALYLFIFVYGIIVIKDVKLVQTEEHGDGPKVVERSSLHAIAGFFDLKHVKEAFRVTFQQGSENKRFDIMLLLVIIVVILGPLSG